MKKFFDIVSNAISREIGGKLLADSSTPLSLSSDAKIMEMFAAHQQNATHSCYLPNDDIAFQSKLKLKKQIYSRIKVADDFNKKLSPEQIDQEVARLYELTCDFFHYQESVDKLDRIFNSDNFSYVAVESFPESPSGLGVYRNERHVLEVSDPRRINVCNDESVTVKHELHHADMKKLHFQAKPFTDEQEKTHLEKAIKQGDARVDIFNNLHQLKIRGKLKDPKQVAQYDHFKKAVASYQPRCVSYNYHLTPSELKSIKKSLRRGKKPSFKSIFVTHVVEVDGMVILTGNHVSDVNDIHQKPYAFIRDTYWRIDNYKMMYQANLQISKSKAQEISIIESDAEINANSPEILKEFYPELVAYHEGRRAQAEESAASSLRVKR